MPQKRVSALAAGINAVTVVTGGEQVITGITNDSRQITAGGLYAALPGLHVDGHAFIDAAVRAGAAAILCSRVPANLPDGVAVLRANDERLALSALSDAFHDHPSERIEVIGITGTDGKTSTVSFLHQILSWAGGASSYLSTAGRSIGGTEEPNRRHQSTPEAPEVHTILSDMALAGAEYCVLESTSHGLSARTHRLSHVQYRAAVMTNITHEHLEFHGSYENYRRDKGNLFRALDNGRIALAASGLAPGERVFSWEDARAAGLAGERFGIVNCDSPEAMWFRGCTAQPVAGYGLEAPATLRGENLVPDATGTTFTMIAGATRTELRMPSPGSFNVENVLASVLTAALLTGAEPGDLAPAVESLRPVRGRMQVVCSQPFAVVVDYAHTPGSFEKVIPFFRLHTPGKLIVVFGSAGERDVEKRPVQGRIAHRYADLIILANEDPRDEPEQHILDGIAAGCPERTEGRDLLRIPNRTEAIRRAVAEARPGDTVLLLGKGHEASIIGPDGEMPWDEEQAAREALRAAGSGPDA